MARKKITLFIYLFLRPHEKKKGGPGRARRDALHVRISSINTLLNEMNCLWTGLNEKRLWQLVP